MTFRPPEWMPRIPHKLLGLVSWFLPVRLTYEVACRVCGQTFQFASQAEESRAWDHARAHFRLLHPERLAEPRELQEADRV